MRGMTRRASFGAAFSVTVGALAGCSSAHSGTDSGAHAQSSASASLQLKVVSDVMEPTLAKGQTVTVGVVADGKYRPRRQDIVLFHPPKAWEGLSPSNLIFSRVIGIPGDRVSCARQGSPILLNGTVLKEPYLYPGDSASWIAFDVTVPSGRLWLLDDHRSVGRDSRLELSDPDNGAFVPVGNVVGICNL